MKVVVAGGGGFIGSHVVEALARSDHEVTILDRLPNRFDSPPPGVECRWADWTNTDELDRALEGTEVVVHLISSSVPATADVDIARDALENVIGTVRLLDSCVKNGVPKLVFASSGGAVYGLARELPIPESHPTDPVSAYGIAKLAAEKYIQLYGILHGLQYAILRGSNPFGERQDPERPQGAVAVFMGQLLRGKPIDMLGNGDTVKDYFYVGDLADAFRIAVESPAASGTYNIGSGEGLSLTDLLRVIVEVTGLTPEVRHHPARVTDVPANVLDVAKAGRELGWRPETDLRDALGRTWRWLQARYR